MSTDTLAAPLTTAAQLRPACVALAVRDLPRTERFYRDVLGLAVLDRQADTARLGAGGRVLLDLLHRPDALPDDPAAAGLFHAAFLLPTRAALGRWLRHAAAAGQALDGASDHAVSEAIYLHDPEGNGVEVYADRPRDAWRWHDGRVAMGTRPLDVAAVMAAAGGEPWSGAPAATRLGHVHLRVGDAEEAARFYAGALGLDVTAAGRDAVFLSWNGYHHHLAANAWRSAGAGRRDPGRAGLVSVTLHGAAPAVLHDPWNTEIRLVSSEETLP